MSLPLDPARGRKSAASPTWLSTKMFHPEDTPCSLSTPRPIAPMRSTGPIAVGRRPTAGPTSGQIAALGHDPNAMLGFTVTFQDYEGDQATFSKVPTDDMERLFGLRLLELAVFDRLEAHVAEQCARGRIVVVEVDGHFLPDTLGVSYRVTHPKTTIGITRIDPERRRLDYFHNEGFFSSAPTTTKVSLGVPARRSIRPACSPMPSS